MEVVFVRNDSRDDADDDAVALSTGLTFPSAPDVGWVALLFGVANSDDGGAVATTT